MTVLVYCTYVLDTITMVTRNERAIINYDMKSLFQVSKLLTTIYVQYVTQFVS